MQAEYAADKPNDCRFCYFWKNDSTGCSLGKDNCYYLISLCRPSPKASATAVPMAERIRASAGVPKK